MSEQKRDHSLWITLVVSVIIISAIGAVLYLPIGCVTNANIAAGLTNIGTVGGIISGLSLSGTAVLTLNGRYTVRLLERWGSAIRFVLFGGFSLLVATALLCALSVMWVGQIWPRYVLAYSIPVMLVTLIATALLINSAFAWGRSSTRQSIEASPYKKKASSAHGGYQADEDDR